MFFIIILLNKLYRYNKDYLDEELSSICLQLMQGRIQGGAMGAKPPLDLCNL